MEIYYTILDDAYYFLQDLKSLPQGAGWDAISARYNRFAHAVVFFSWAALEFTLEDAIYTIRLRGIHALPSPPKTLKKRIEYVLRETGKPPLDGKRFDKNRHVRNKLFHGNLREIKIDFSVAEEAFNFCFDTINSYYPDSVKVGHFSTK